MVLDPFSALGLAGNVVQFVDFGTKLFSEAAELYRSVDGTLQVNAQLEAITEDLSSISNELGNASSYEGQPLSADVKNLMNLALSCKDLADELLLVLTKLKVSSNHKKWKSIRQAFASAWRGREVEAYMGKLDRFRSQMTVHLVAILSNKQSSVMKALDNLSKRHQRLEVLSVNEPERLKRDILAAMEQMSSESAKQKDLLDLKGKLSAFENESSKLDFGLKVLETLQFPMINSRQANIAVAHSSTYEWMFNCNPALNPQFVHWLESQNGIYWINGKAGCGKSTLMKFISSDKRTAESLRIWAGNHTLVMASYFFWKSGTDMQKSLEGLLRSLLYRILQQCPTMIDALAGPQTDQMSMDTHSWSLQDLLATFLRLRTNEASIKFCFFIDGLDEYDGFHADVIDIIMSLTTSPNIKVCLSSRPWNIFEDTFGGGAYPNLRVHDWTGGDIRSYVMDTFEGDRHFARLKIRDKQYEYLASQIVEKAQGVFLWVFLVVRSLLRGLTNADTISDLQRRLALLPSDLENYFRFMLDSTEKVYHQQAAQMLQTCLASRAPLSLVTLSFHDEQDPDYGMKPRVERWTQDDLDELHHQMRKRVNARCGDLVEVTMEKGSQKMSPFVVEFLHTTVRDFLETKEIQDILAQRQGEEFDPDKYLCQAYLAQMKHIPSAMNQFTNCFIFHAFRLECKVETPQITLMDEFIRIHTQEKSPHPDLKWHLGLFFSMSNIYWGSSESQRLWVLMTCVRGGLALYVKSQLEAPDLHFGPNYINRLLAYALNLNSLVIANRVTMLSFEIRAKILRTLIDHGADPNYVLEGRPVWGVLRHALSRVPKGGIEQEHFTRCIEMLLSKGTNPSTDTIARDIIESCTEKDRSRLYALCLDKDPPKKLRGLIFDGDDDV